MRKVAIVGFGRFGKVLYRLLRGSFTIRVYDSSRKVFDDFEFEDGDRAVTDIEEIYDSNAIFYAVPIDAFKSVIDEHSQYFKDHLLIDVLSVKQHPQDVLSQYPVRAILTHPMFGPDSINTDFKDLTFVMDQFTAKDDEYGFWRSYFTEKGFNIIEMSPGDHDRLAASSQGITHFIGRLLDELGLEPTSIDTMGAKKLKEIIDDTCNDTWQLFYDLQSYNPFTKDMRVRLGEAYDKLYNNLLPDRVDDSKLTIGIQGGEGSFNEEAILDYVSKNEIKSYEIVYLYTTPKVLEALHRGDVDMSLFAIQNSVGGLVEESVRAMADYKFHIVEEVNILVRHFLMKKEGAEINTIMAHPQVFKQCVQTLKEKYSSFQLKSGEEDMVDTARIAKSLSGGEIDESMAILGPKRLSELYNFEIVAEDLQDDEENYTTFLLVSRKRNDI